MQELLNVNADSQTVSARELHEKLNISTRFNDWFRRMCEYGFEEQKDFYSKMSKPLNRGADQQLIMKYHWIWQSRSA